MHAERERELVGSVADGKAGEGWDARLPEDVVEDFAER